MVNETFTPMTPVNLDHSSTRMERENELGKLRVLGKENVVPRVLSFRFIERDGKERTLGTMLGKKRPNWQESPPVWFCDFG